MSHSLIKTQRLIEVRPASLVKNPGELFIAYTFKRLARAEYSVNEAESEAIFAESLRLKAIVADRIVYPDVQAYRVLDQQKTFSFKALKKV